LALALEERTERQASLQSTGDPEIQEKFLQGAVADAMQHSFHALQYDPQPSSSNNHQTTET